MEPEVNDWAAKHLQNLGPWMTTKYTPTADPGAKADTKVPMTDALNAWKAREQKQYIRPNGEVYLPRKMTAGTSVVHDVTMLRTAIDSEQPVLLYGEPGCGKTAMVEAAFGDELVTVQGTVETETADFVGSWVQQTDGTYLWVDGPLVVALEDGKKLLVDEIALIDPRVMAVVYGVMDGRDELVITQNPSRGVVKKADGFQVVGAFNPNVPGAILSDALLSRFQIHVEVSTDWGLANQLGVPDKMVMVARNLNLKFREGEVTQAPQLRELITFRDTVATFGETFAIRNIISQCREENRPIVAAEISKVFGTPTEQKALAL